MNKIFCAGIFFSVLICGCGHMRWDRGVERGYRGEYSMVAGKDGGVYRLNTRTGEILFVNGDKAVPVVAGWEAKDTRELGKLKGYVEIVDGVGEYGGLGWEPKIGEVARVYIEHFGVVTLPLERFKNLKEGMRLDLIFKMEKKHRKKIPGEIGRLKAEVEEHEGASYEAIGEQPKFGEVARVIFEDFGVMDLPVKRFKYFEEGIQLDVVFKVDREYDKELTKRMEEYWKQEDEEKKKWEKMRKR